MIVYVASESFHRLPIADSLSLIVFTAWLKSLMGLFSFFACYSSSGTSLLARLVSILMVALWIYGYSQVNEPFIYLVLGLIAAVAGPLG